MIPVLGLAYINRSDLFIETVTSINHPVDTLVIVDNSKDMTCPQVDGARYLKMHRNMGVAWSWNTIIMNTREAPWWAIANTDLRFGADDLERMDAAMSAGADLVLMGDMAFFGISGHCIQTVGWFDVNFVPAYCEDNDYVHRARLCGIEPAFLTPGYLHHGSMAIKSDPGLRAGNDRSFPMNVRYYREKWGGYMEREVYKTPFDRGGSPRDVPALDLDRLRALSWD